MSPEDCYWLVSKMVERFPGLVTTTHVNGEDLVEWISGEVRRDPLLQQIAKGNTIEDDTDLLSSKIALPTCPECSSTDFFENVKGSEDLCCGYCQTIWKKQDVV